MGAFVGRRTEPATKSTGAAAHDAPVLRRDARRFRVALSLLPVYDVPDPLDDMDNRDVRQNGIRHDVRLKSVIAVLDGKIAEPSFVNAQRC